MKHSYWFWKISLVVPILLSTAVTLLVATSRQSNEYTCLQLSYFDYPVQQQSVLGQQIKRSALPKLPQAVAMTMDVTRNRLAVDRRQPPFSFALNSPDRRYRIGLAASPDIDNMGDLVLQQVASAQAVPESTVVQRHVTDEYRSVNQYTSLTWLPDSQHFAYLWRNDAGTLMLTLADVQGESRQTTLDFANAALGSWSKDGVYFTLEHLDKNNSPQYMEIRRTATLERVSQTTFSNGVWSGVEQRFAGFQQTGDRHLVIWSPQGDVSTLLPADIQQDNTDVFWSPDGRYVVVLSTMRCLSSKACVFQRRFDIFDSQGHLLVENLAGSELPVSAPGDIFPHDAAWTSDGQHFVFVQTSLRRDKPVHDLLSLSLIDGSQQSLATDLVSAYMHMAFFLEHRFLALPGQGDMSKPSSNRLLIVTWQADKIRVELVDLDGTKRSTLVTGADELLFSPTNPLENLLWTNDGQWIVIPWATRRGTQKEAHLTWVRSDGSGLRHIDGLTQLEQVSVVAVADKPHYIGYLHSPTASRLYSFQLVDLNSSRHQDVLDSMGLLDKWSVSIASTSRQTALLVGMENVAQPLFLSSRMIDMVYGAAGLTFNGGILSGIATRGLSFGGAKMQLNHLYLLSDNATPRLVGDDVFGTLYWSPDGSQLAYLSFDVVQQKIYVNVVTANGERLSRMAVQKQEQLTLWGWTRCR